MSVFYVKSQGPIMAITVEVFIKMHVMMPVASLEQRLVGVMNVRWVHVRRNFIYMI